MNSENRLPRPAVETRDGFTLMEVLVSMLVLTLGTLGLMHLSVAGLTMTQHTATVTELGIRAENVIDAALDRGYAGNPVGVTEDTVYVHGTRYTRRVNVTDVNSRLREVRVDVIPVGVVVPAYSATTYVVW